MNRGRIRGRAMAGARSCPVCPGCGSGRFERLQGPGVRLRCRACGREAAFDG